ncbi:MAG: DUF1801 domain-containing protein [Planctomycetota bacterium]
MVTSKATTVAQYLKELPEDRRKAITAVRKVFLAQLDDGFAEGMQYGMIGYHVPHKVFPDGYHCDPKQPLPYAALASQKNHMSIYLFGIYVDPSDVAWFEKAWLAAGKKLDMGKSCIRFKSVDDLALDVLAEALERMPSPRFIAAYEASRAGSAPGKKPAKTAAKKPAKKAPAKKAAVKKSAAKK